MGPDWIQDNYSRPQLVPHAALSHLNRIQI